MTKKKVALTFLRNKSGKKIRAEREKLNELFKNIPTDNITELNDLIYAEAKLWQKDLIPHKKNAKSGWKMRVKEQIKKLRAQKKVLGRKNTHGLDGIKRRKN